MHFIRGTSYSLPGSTGNWSLPDSGSALVNTVVIVLITYFGTFVLESPIRYALSLGSVEWVLYLRDLAILVTLGAIVFRGLINSSVNRALVITIDVLILHSFVSLVYVSNIFQLTFGLKLFLPLVFGVACFSFLHGQIEKLKIPILVLFWIACAGVTINYFIDFPWKGLEFTVGNVTLMGVKEWYSGGFRRLYGFSRTSASVAVQTLIMGSFLMIFLHGKIAKVMVWIATGIAIVLSTTKGVFIAYVVISTFFVVRLVSPSSQEYYLKGLFLVLAMIIILPCISFFTEPRDEWVQAMLTSPLRSFGERIATMWPAGLELILDKGNVIFGRGIGGIGVAQLLFEGEFYHPGDNLFIYGYLLFGVFIVPYLALIVFTAQKLQPQTIPEDAFYTTVLLAYLTYGVTTSVPESGELQLFFGIVLGRVLQSSRDFFKDHTVNTYMAENYSDRLKYIRTAER